MTTFENRPHAALLVVDVQIGVVSENYERDAAVANIERIVEKARREQIPVVWIQDSGESRAIGSDPWKIVPELTPIDAEAHVGPKSWSWSGPRIGSCDRSSWSRCCWCHVGRGNLSSSRRRIADG